MKKIFFLILISINLSAQITLESKLVPNLTRSVTSNVIITPNASREYDENGGKVKWNVFVSVLNEGDSTCRHDFLKSNEDEQGLISWTAAGCLVLHGNDPCGCSYNWPHYWQICKNCLRHEEVKETCETIPQPKKLTYTDLLNKLRNDKKD